MLVATQILLVSKLHFRNNKLEAFESALTLNTCPAQLTCAGNFHMRMSHAGVAPPPPPPWAEIYLGRPSVYTLKPRMQPESPARLRKSELHF